MSESGESWNPMKDEYNRETNSFNKVPRDSQSFNTSNHKFPKKLYVTNIPESMAEASFKNICSKYGQVDDLFISQNRHFAGVTFDNEKSAEHAMKGLNAHPDYGFKATFFKEKTSTDNMAPVMKTSRFSNSQPDVKLAPIPTCVHCNVVTLDVCMKCRVSYCTKKCMVLGFQHHTDVCITIAPHSSDPKSSPSSERCNTSSVAGSNAGSKLLDPARLSHVEAKQEVAEFPLLTKDYLQNQTTSSSNDAPSNGSLNISNSYDNDDLTGENSRYGDDLVKKKSLSTVSGDVAGRGETASSPKYDRSEKKPNYSDQQREKENRPPYSNNYNESRRKSEGTGYRSDASNSQNYDRKMDSRSRDGGKPSSYTASRNDENRSGEFRQKRNHDGGSRHDSRNMNEPNQKRSYDDDKSRYDNREQNDNRKYNNQNSDYRNKRSFEEKVPFKETERGNSSLNEEEIAFSSSPPKFSEKKRPSNESTKKPDSRVRSSEGDSGTRKNSNDRITGETGVLKRQSSSDSNQELEYMKSRRSFEVGEKLEVRLKELYTDTQDFCSIGVVEEESLLPKLKAHLMRETDLPPFDLETTDKCLVCRDDERIRGCIVSKNPLAVKYIDMGGKWKQCDERSLRGCPEKYQLVRPFAYKVKFLNAKEKDLENLKKENRIFEILITRKIKELVWQAEILESNFTSRLEEARQTRASRNGQSPSGESSKTQTRPSRNDQPSSGESSKTQTRALGNDQPSLSPKLCDELVLQPGISVELIITYSQTDKEIFYIGRQCDIMKMTTAIEEQKDLKKLTNIEEDKTCLASLDGGWYRARIIQTNPLKVYFMDFGNTETVKEDDLKEMPVKCHSDNPLATKVKFTRGKPSDYKIKDYECHVFKPVKYIAEDKLWIVTLCEWIEVIVLIELSKSEYYVMKTSDMDVSTKVFELPKTPLTSEPRVGSIYLTEYENQRWRVELLKVSPPTVKYIDYGNEEVTELDKLYELPSEWQKKDPTAFKVSFSPEVGQLEVGKEIFIREEENNVWKVRQ